MKNILRVKVTDVARKVIGKLQFEDSLISK